MRALTKDEETLAAELFKVADVDPREGKTLLTVRFDPTRPDVVFYGPHLRRNKIVYRGATVLRYMEDASARTPTGGRYTRRQLTVRVDGRTWQGYLPHERRGTDVVHLHLMRRNDGESRSV